jgi:hypothetical protein
MTATCLACSTGSWTRRWQALRARRTAEPGAADVAARLAFELGRQVRELREQRGCDQSRLARQADLT